MLYIALVLILAALGLLVAALAAVNSLWAWLSVVVSVLAAAILLVDYLRRRSVRNSRTVASEEDSVSPVADDAEVLDSPVVEPAVAKNSVVEKRTELLPVTGELPPEKEDEASTVVRSGTPGEEQSSAADLLVIIKLDVEVAVVDEHPRYHLFDCEWLKTQDIIPIALPEAVELGFTPCARCTPNAKLVDEYHSLRLNLI